MKLDRTEPNLNTEMDEILNLKINRKLWPAKDHSSSLGILSGPSRK